MLGFALLCRSLSLTLSESDRRNVAVPRKRVSAPSSAGDNLNTISQKLEANSKDVLTTLQILGNATSESLREVLTTQLLQEVKMGNLLRDNALLILESNQQLKKKRVHRREVRRKELDSNNKSVTKFDGCY
jgi:hypothetical protein